MLTRLGPRPPFGLPDMTLTLFWALAASNTCHIPEGGPPLQARDPWSALPPLHPVLTDLFPLFIAQGTGNREELFAEEEKKRGCVAVNLKEGNWGFSGGSVQGMVLLDSQVKNWPVGDKGLMPGPGRSHVPQSN